jgi:hypothetical protein
MRLAPVAASLSCLLALACATTSAPVVTGPPPDWKLANATMAAGDTFEFVGQSGGQITVKITGHDLYGPQYNLSAGGGYVRGQGSGGAVIDVTIKGNRGDGSVKNAPFSCIVETNADGSARVTGAMGAGNTDYVISQREISGRVGIGVITMTWSPTNNRYEGMPTGAHIQLPAVMASWSNVEVGCVLSILLTN